MSHEDSTSVYEYSISGDFNVPIPSLTCLEIEIGDSSITKNVRGIFAQGDDVTVQFNLPLSVAEETTLDGLVAAHTGTCPESEEQERESTNPVYYMDDLFDVDTTARTRSTWATSFRWAWPRWKSWPSR